MFNNFNFRFTVNFDIKAIFLDDKDETASPRYIYKIACQGLSGTFSGVNHL
jgi:hypothetical protein